LRVVNMIHGHLVSCVRFVHTPIIYLSGQRPTRKYQAHQQEPLPSCLLLETCMYALLHSRRLLPLFQIKLLGMKSCCSNLLFPPPKPHKYAIVAVCCKAAGETKKSCSVWSFLLCLKRLIQACVHAGHLFTKISSLLILGQH
jgi:hypothetical protein